MGFFDFLKSKPAADIPSPLEKSEVEAVAKITASAMQFKEGKPYLALVGQTFDAWGIVDVSGDTRTHIAVKSIPAAILAKTGATAAPEIVAIERKLVLAHTKGFHDLPRDEAFELLDTLRDNLMSQMEDMKERGEAMFAEREMETAADAKWLRDDLKELEREFRDYWRDDLKEFREKTLPEAMVDYWDTRRDEAEAEMEYAKQAKQRAMDKIRK